MVDSPSNCTEKQAALKTIFSECTTAQQKYEKIIEMGRALPPYPEELKKPEYLVSGCQSVMYLCLKQDPEGRLRFHAHSEALISAGLAALLVFVYEGERPESILLHPPHFLTNLGISTSLSPSRSNGLASLVSAMQKQCLNLLKRAAPLGE